MVYSYRELQVLQEYTEIFSNWLIFSVDNYSTKNETETWRRRRRLFCHCQCCMIAYEKNYENNLSKLNFNENIKFFIKNENFTIVDITMYLRAFLLFENIWSYINNFLMKNLNFPLKFSQVNFFQINSINSYVNLIENILKSIDFFKITFFRHL